jgi:hypothetical protein
MGGLGSGKGSGGVRPGAGRRAGVPNVRTLANEEIVKRRNFKTLLELMLEIINNPETTEERRDKFIIAAAPYLHAKPATLMIADAAARQFLNGTTSLTDTSPFASASDAMDFLEQSARRADAVGARNSRSK